MNATEPDLRNTAGPYGFTRREIGVLAGVIVVCIAVIGYSEWRDSKRPAPAWVIEDVPLDREDVVRSAEESSAATSRDSQSTSRGTQSDLIDVNSADQRSLARLPGIGVELARRIIEERSSAGPFLNLTDLQRVKGIGPRKAAMLSGWVRFSSEPSSAKDSSDTP